MKGPFPDKGDERYKLWYFLILVITMQQVSRVGPRSRYWIFFFLGLSDSFNQLFSTNNLLVVCAKPNAK